MSAHGRVRTNGYGMVFVDPAGGVRPGTPLAAFEGVPAGDFLARVRRLAAAHPHGSGR